MLHKEPKDPFISCFDKIEQFENPPYVFQFEKFEQIIKKGKENILFEGFIEFYNKKKDKFTEHKITFNNQVLIRYSVIIKRINS